MKLSEIKGERTLDVIADLVEPIANIAEDDTAAALFKREKLPEGESARAYTIKRMKSALPNLIKGHRQDLIAILATINGVTDAEYAGALSMVKLVRDAWDLITDNEFLSLFTSLQGQDVPSGSASESTEARET